MSTNFTNTGDGDRLDKMCPSARKAGLGTAVAAMDTMLDNMGQSAAEYARTVAFSFSAAQIKTLYSANTNKGLQIVAAPGAGKYIEFLSAILYYDYDGSNAYTAANGLTFNVDATAVSDTLAATLLQATADQLGVVQTLSGEWDGAASGLLNKALYLQEGTTDPTGSATASNQLIVRVRYRIVSATSTS